MNTTPLPTIAPDALIHEVYEALDSWAMQAEIASVIDWGPFRQAMHRLVPEQHECGFCYTEWSAPIDVCPPCGKDRHEPAVSPE